MRACVWIGAMLLMIVTPQFAAGQSGIAAVAVQESDGGWVDRYGGVAVVASLGGALVVAGAAAKGPVAAGTIGGLGGFALGFAPGAAIAIATGARPIIECADCDAGLQAGLVGGYIGMALLTPYLVHRKSGREGSLGAAYQRSAAIAGAGLATMFWGISMEDRSFGGTSAPSAASFLLTPVLQVVSAVRTEKRTVSRSR
jgi:hypothetical protein